MNLDLDGRTVVVTGAGSGIGAATAGLLLAEGASVLAVDRDEAGLDALAEAQGSPRLRTLAADVTDAETATAARDLALAEFEGVDALVNGVGVAVARDGFLETGLDEWRRGFDVNLFSAVAMCRAFLPALLRRRGTIVNVASTSGRYPEPMLVDYAAAKAGLLSLTGALAQEFGPRGVRAVAMSPGPTRTELWERPGGFIDALAERTGLDREAAVEHHVREVRRVALGRPAEAEDAARAIVFLCSTAAKHITGTNLAVHGGMATHLM
ncbi:SDR family oxidoreductase [Leucobacter sp. CSA1]|uniref:SDR family oxidoreductase n=1 Tax=Leucobacter chromiisoli TaxID=2796471 RepID=A0A934UV61_9MICO|nr:SDR family oxidoreductase [Leucobacter chromiisoli]MBK0418893.1 SDR family oxidoreductase [Leucobacter chromiisoli]